MVPVLLLLLGVPAQTGRWLRRTTAAAGAKVLRFGVRVGIAPALALAPRRGTILGQSIGPPRLLLLLLLLLLESGPPSMPASVCCPRRRAEILPSPAADWPASGLRFGLRRRLAYYHARTHAHFYTLDEDFSHTNYIFFFLARTPLWKSVATPAFFRKMTLFPIPGGSACRHQFFSELFLQIQENFPQKSGKSFTFLAHSHKFTIPSHGTRRRRPARCCREKSGKKNQFLSGDAEFRSSGHLQTHRVQLSTTKTFTHSRLRERKNSAYQD
uniref:(northern house mosquito) hypothetical protein n=1 Tax=Culex pipiens TaxID=7175 RepID=A0A8D8DZY1_CULPI